jgi:dTDP-4-dehydrorhamnose 3,5-epimerase
MEFRRLAIPDVVLIEPKVFADDRGSFFESFNVHEFERGTGLRRDFVQDNHSTSRRGVLRGLHYQLPPFAQGKLVRVVQGSVFDVAVDIRPGSPTFGKWVSEILSSGNRRQLWIPEGFAHGFLAFEDDTQLLYKATAPYNPASERTVAWNDGQLAISWPLVAQVVLSVKDAQAPRLADADLYGTTQAR